MNSNWVTGILVVIVVLIGAYVFTRPAVSGGPQGPQGVQGLKGDKGDVGAQGPRGFSGEAGADGGQSFGAVSGPDSFFPCTSNEGITTCVTRIAMRTATTTVCAIKSPAATSTLVSGTARFTYSSTTAPLVRFAKATTPYATTTALGNATIAAGAQGTLQASSTPVGALGDITVFEPSSYLVVALSGGVGTFSPTGICQATFEVI